MRFIRPVCVLAALLTLAAPTRAQAPKRDRQAELDQLREFLSGATDRLHSSAGALERDFKLPEGSAFGGMLQSSEEIRKAMLAAAESVKVHPAAEKAGELFGHSDFQLALEACQTALRDDPRDPYALYLAGLCEIECGRFESAAGLFDQAFSREPASRTSRLLAEFCRRMREHEPPHSDEVILTCLYEAHAAVEKELKLPAPKLFDLSGGPFIVDPLLLKIEAEGFAGYGPLAFSADQYMPVLARQDPHAYYWLARPNAHDPAELRRTLGLSDTDPLCDGVDLLAKYFSDKSAEDSDPPGYLEDVQKLCDSQPDEGLWILLRIPPFSCDRSLANAENDDGLEQFERAAAAPRLTFPIMQQVAARRQLFAAGRYPFADRAIEQIGTRYNVFSRIRGIFRNPEPKLPLCGDSQLARLSAAAHRLASRLTTQDAALAARIGAIRAGWQWTAAKIGLKSQSLSAQQALQELITLREYASFVALATPTMHFLLLPEHLPSPSLSSAAIRASRGQWPPWKVRLARRCAAARDDVQVTREALEQLPGSLPSAGQLCAGAATLGFRELMPQIRHLRDGDCCPETLYAIVWATGELGGSDDIPWLIECLAKPPAWLPLAAAASLRQITGKDYGTDAGAWRHALDQP